MLHILRRYYPPQLQVQPKDLQSRQRIERMRKEMCWAEVYDDTDGTVERVPISDVRQLVYAGVAVNGVVDNRGLTYHEVETFRATEVHLDEVDCGIGIGALSYQEKNGHLSVVSRGTVFICSIKGFRALQSLCELGVIRNYKGGAVDLKTAASTVRSGWAYTEDIIFDGHPGVVWDAQLSNILAEKPYASEKSMSWSIFYNKTVRLYYNNERICDMSQPFYRIENCIYSQVKFTGFGLHSCIGKNEKVPMVSIWADMIRRGYSNI